MKSSTKPFICGDILNPDYSESPATLTRSPLEMLVRACNSIGHGAAAESVNVLEGKKITMSTIIKPKARVAMKGFRCQSPVSNESHERPALHSVDESSNPMALRRSRNGSPSANTQPLFASAPEQVPLATPLHRLAVEDGQFNPAAYQLWLDFFMSAQSKTNGLSNTNNNHPFHAVLNSGCPLPGAPSQPTANHAWCNPDYLQHSSPPQSVLNALNSLGNTPAVLSYLTALARAQQSKPATTTDSHNAPPCHYQPCSACPSCTSLPQLRKPTPVRREHAPEGQPQTNTNGRRKIEDVNNRKNAVKRTTSRKHTEDADAAVPKSMRLSSGLRNTQSKCTSPSTSGDSLK